MTSRPELSGARTPLSDPGGGGMGARSASRIVAALILAQIVCGAVLNFVLLAPLFGAPGFLVNAAPNALQIGLSVLFALAAGGLSLGIAITAFPIFRQHSQAIALWFVALAVAGLSLTAVENMNVMSMVSLSEAYSKASAADRDQFQA